MRALLASPLGFLVGLSLGALGGGGSIIAVPVLVYAAGQDPRSATTTSLFLVGMASLVGLVAHWRAGRVRVGVGIAFGLLGIGGSFVGSMINQRLDPNVLLLGFAALVCVAAWRMLTHCPTCTRVGEEQALATSTGKPASDTLTPPAVTSGPGSRSGSVAVVAAPARTAVGLRTAVTVLAAGTAVGFLTGLFGVGGGFVIVPALALALALPMPEAIGTSLLVIAINSAFALATRLATSSIDWSVSLPFTLAAMAGVLSGSKISDRLDAERSLRWFAGLLIAVAAYTAIRAGMSLAA